MLLPLAAALAVHAAAARANTVRADTVRAALQRRALDLPTDTVGTDSSPARRRRWPREYCTPPEPQADCVRVVPFELFFPRGGPRAGTGPRVQPYLGLEAGVLRNMGPRSARGVTLLLGLGTADRERLGLRFRYRRWLMPQSVLPSAVDLSAGPLVAAVHTGFDTAAVRRAPRQAPGFGGELAVEAGGVVGVSVRPEVVWAHGQTVRSVDVGVRAGSRLSVGVVRLFGLVVGALLGGAAAR